jgi:hypothetical protein
VRQSFLYVSFTVEEAYFFSIVFSTVAEAAFVPTFSAAPTKPVAAPMPAAFATLFVSMGFPAQ